MPFLPEALNNLTVNTFVRQKIHTTASVIG